MSKKSLIILVSIVVILLFYWYQIRPSIIRHECSNIAIKSAQQIYVDAYNSTGNANDCYEAQHGYFDTRTYDDYYKICLTNKGL